MTEKYCWLFHVASFYQKQYMFQPPCSTPSREAVDSPTPQTTDSSARDLRRSDLHDSDGEIEGLKEDSGLFDVEGWSWNWE